MLAWLLIHLKGKGHIPSFPELESPSVPRVSPADERADRVALGNRPTQHMPKITKRAVDALTPNPERDVFLVDTELKGFGVRMKSSGSAAYFIRYKRPDGSGLSWTPEFGQPTEAS